MAFDGDEKILIPALEFSPGHREFFLRFNRLRCKGGFLGSVEDNAIPNSEIKTSVRYNKERISLSPD